MLIDFSRPKKLIDVIDRGFEQLILPESQAGFWACFVFGMIVFGIVVIAGYGIAEIAVRIGAQYASERIGDGLVGKFIVKIILYAGQFAKHEAVSFSIHVAMAMFPIVSTVAFVAIFQESLIKKIEIRWYGLGYSEAISNIRMPFSLFMAGILYVFLAAAGCALSMLPGPFALLGAVVSAYAGIEYLSRCYFDAVALRRLSLKQVSNLRRKNRFRILTIGIILHGMFSIPGVNLLAAIVGTAMMVHMQWWLCGEVAVNGQMRSI